MTHTDDQPTATTPPKRKAGRAKLAIAGAVLAVAAVGGGTYAVLQGTDAGASSATDGAMAGGGSGGGQGGTGGPPSGTVVSTTADSITVKLSSGTETTYTLADGATVQDDGTDVALTDLTAGEQVMILTGQPGSDSTEATRVLAGSSAQAGPGGGTAPDGAPQDANG